MNNRIAKKILECKSSLWKDSDKVYKAKLLYLQWSKYWTKLYPDGILMCSKHRKGLKK